ILHIRRRCLQLTLRLLAANAEHYLARHLNAYLQDDDEYRAITRETIIRGLAGTITYTPGNVTVALDQPGQGRVTRALTLLLAKLRNPRQIAFIRLQQIFQPSQAVMYQHVSLLPRNPGYCRQGIDRFGHLLIEPFGH